MKMSIKLFSIKLFVAIFAVLATSLSAQQQKSDYKSEPGYVDFGDLSSMEIGDKVTEVTLDEQLLKLAAGFSKNDKDVNSVLNGIKLIKVNSFEVTKKNRDQVLNKIKAVDEDLTRKNWNRIVKSRSKDENSNVYVKTGSNGQVVGLVVTNYGKNGEVAFINIIGNIDMDAMTSLSEKFNIPSLNHFNSHKK